jgi:hypothetical protein
MADNIPISAGSGVTVATDQVGAIHYQVIKVADGTADSENRWLIDSDNAGKVKFDSGATVAVSNLPDVTLGTGTSFVGLVTVANEVAINDGGNTITVDGTVDIGSALPAGSNNIGDVDVASNTAWSDPGTYIGLATIVPGSQIARDNATDTITASLDTNALMNDTTALTPKFAVVDAASSGDNTLVSAVAAKKIRVHSVFMVAAGAVNVRFEDGAGGTALTGQMNLATNGGFVLPFNPVGWFETTANTLLNLELSAAVSVDGSLQYTEV